jgi:FkbM family methyltransferase
MFGRLLRPLIGKKQFYPFFWKLYQLSLRGMNIGLGGGVTSSGENNVLSYVKAHSAGKKPLVIFDVGANKGQYTKNLLAHFQDTEAEIHCFEPGHETFRILAGELNGRQNITLNNFGLSDKKSEGVLYYDKAGSGLASLYKRQLDYFNIDFEQSEAVVLDTLDNYVSSKAITSIDLLKIDVEGNELNVLSGAHEALSAGIIRAIQIEFGGCNIDSRTFIRDFWNLLHNDFVMYRIMKNGLIEIPCYDERIENFTCTNFFFAKR